MRTIKPTECEKAKLIDKLEGEFQKLFDSLQTPDFSKNVERMIGAKGKFSKPTKLGPPR